MSFLLKALGGLGGGFLGKAAGFLSSKIAPFASKVAGYMGGLFSNPTVRSIGKSALDFAVNSAINKGSDYANQFSNSDFVRKRLPIVAPFIKDGAEALRNRLRDGYSDIMNPG